MKFIVLLSDESECAPLIFATPNACVWILSSRSPLSQITIPLRYIVMELEPRRWMVSISPSPSLSPIVGLTLARPKAAFPDKLFQSGKRRASTLSDAARTSSLRQRTKQVFGSSTSSITRITQRPLQPSSVRSTRTLGSSILQMQRRVQMPLAILN